MPNRLSHTLFAKHLNETFRVNLENASDVKLILKEVTPLDKGSGQTADDDTQWIPFNLLFEGPGSPALAQMLYPLAHEKLNDLQLFLVPIGPLNQGMGYEAIFN